MRPHRDEHVLLDVRRHPVVLARAVLVALALAVAGAALVRFGWPLSPLGAALLAAAAVRFLVAVVRWERTRVVLTTERLCVVHGVVRTRAVAVRLARVGAVEVEQALLGRVLGYGTLSAGELEIAFVPQPREVFAAVDRLCA